MCVSVCQFHQFFNIQIRYELNLKGICMSFPMFILLNFSKMPFLLVSVALEGYWPPPSLCGTGPPAPEV